MLYNIEKYIKKPDLYTPSTARFWDDDHISKGMLEAHLNAKFDSATRNHDFVQQSVDWISSIAPAREYPQLLDLGCGPGIYAELFDDATLIYCDFGVLSTKDRAALLKKIYAALRPNGRLIFDVFTPRQYAGQEEYRSWIYEKSGFWSETPYLCLNSLYRYDEDNTFLRQHLVITEDEVNCYNVWEHTFTKEDLQRDLVDAGFRVVGFYGDVSGRVATNESTQLCVVADIIFIGV